MAHRLLVPPVRRLEGTARLPMLQDVGGAVARTLTSSMMTRDSLRRVKNTGTHKCTGPLVQLQVFAMSGPGYPNTPESMASGLRRGNARRLMTKTTGKGFGP